MEKVITIFRTKQCKQGKALREVLNHEDIDQDCVQVVYINESPAIATFFGVTKSPTVLLFEEGEEIERYEGDEIRTHTVATIFDFLMD